MSERAVRFGFLPLHRQIDFDGGKIIPVDEFKEAQAWIEKYTLKDGFLYPPTILEVDDQQQPIKDTRRPAHLHRIPVSHLLELSAPIAEANLLQEDGAFVMHFLGALFDVRLQFEEWWIDMRVRMKRPNELYPHSDIASDCLSHCYNRWRRWDNRTRRLATNALYMFCRCPSYEWGWERFLHAYIVLDAIFAIACSLQSWDPRKRCGHGKRMSVLCNLFEIPYNKRVAEEIVRLRNDLFHEALWGGGNPAPRQSGRRL